MLRRSCPVLAALTTAATLRDCEIQLCPHVSRSHARSLIRNAKARSPSFWRRR